MKTPPDLRWGYRQNKRIGNFRRYYLYIRSRSIVTIVLIHPMSACLFCTPKHRNFVAGIRWLGGSKTTVRWGYGVVAAVRPYVIFSFNDCLTHCIVIIVSADVLSKNPDSLALSLVLLAYSRGLVQTVRGGPGTCLVSAPQNPDTNMPNSLINKHLFCRGSLIYGDRYFTYMGKSILVTANVAALPISRTVLKHHGNLVGRPPRDGMAVS